jgi:hypothetical protein
MQKDKACALAPSPTLPRKRERERTESVAGSSPRKRGPIFQKPVVMGPRFRGDDSMS